MHLSIAMLFTLMATIQLATTAPAPVPVPQWDSKGVEAGYKAGAVVCGVGAYICNKLGHTVGQDVLATGAFCCGGMAAAVTAAQSQRWRDGATALGTAAQVIGGKSVAFGRDAMYVARCGINVCTMVINLARGNAPALRSIDAPPAYKNKNLVSGYAQPQLEIKEDTVRLARYTDEPKSEKNVFDIN